MVTLAGLHQPDDEVPGQPEIVRQAGGKVTITITRGEEDPSDPVDRTCGFPLGLVGFGVAGKSLLMAACRFAQPDPPFHADNPANRVFLPAGKAPVIVPPDCRPRPRWICRIHNADLSLLGAVQARYLRGRVWA